MVALLEWWTQQVTEEWIGTTRACPCNVYVLELTPRVILYNFNYRIILITSELFRNLLYQNYGNINGKSLRIFWTNSLCIAGLNDIRWEIRSTNFVANIAVYSSSLKTSQAVSEEFGHIHFPLWHEIFMY